MSNCELSIVIPVSRMAGKLGNLKKTISASSSSPIQFILVHDVQDDSTAHELANLMDLVTKERIILVNGKFGNPGSARNAGLELCSSDYVAFWDSDDLPNVAESLKMLTKMIEMNAEVAIGGIATMKFGEADSYSDFPIKIIQDEKSLFKLAEMPAFTRMIFRREIAQSASFPEISIGEDLAFLGRTNFLNRKVLIYNHCVYLYILDFPGQLTSNKSKLKEVSKAWRYLDVEYSNSTGQMKTYLLFQLYRNFAVTLKNTRKFSLHSLVKLAGYYLNSPFLSTRIMTQLMRNRSILGKRSQN